MSVTVHRVLDPMWNKVTVVMKTDDRQYGTSFRIFGQDGEWYWWNVDICTFMAQQIKAIKKATEAAHL